MIWSYGDTNRCIVGFFAYWVLVVMAHIIIHTEKLQKLIFSIFQEMQKSKNKKTVLKECL